MISPQAPPRWQPRVLEPFRRLQLERTRAAGVSGAPATPPWPPARVPSASWRGATRGAGWRCGGWRGRPSGERYNFAAAASATFLHTTRGVM